MPSMVKRSSFTLRMREDLRLRCRSSLRRPEAELVVVRAAAMIFGREKGSRTARDRIRRAQNPEDVAAAVGPARVRLSSQHVLQTFQPVDDQIDLRPGRVLMPEVDFFWKAWMTHSASAICTASTRPVGIAAMAQRDLEAPLPRPCIGLAMPAMPPSAATVSARCASLRAASRNSSEASFRAALIHDILGRRRSHRVRSLTSFAKSSQRRAGLTRRDGCHAAPAHGRDGK